MRLAIDVGNTEIKVAAESESGFEFLARAPTADAVGFLVQLPPAEFVAIASVVPAVSLQIESLLQSEHQFLSGLDAPGLDIAYKTKETLGADRIANAIFLAEGPRPAVSVDFGTATKIDVVDVEGRYLGGAILPSARMMIESLGRGTAQLKEVPLVPPPHATGMSTTESLQSGTILALVKAVDGLVAAMQEELGSPAHVWATGGLSSQFVPLCRSVSTMEPYLTLKGLLIAARRWSSHL